MELNHTVLCKPSSCAGTLVMETGPADDVAVDCSEGAAASNTHDNNATTATICCINWTACYEYTTGSEEESDVKKTFVLTQKQIILQNNSISVNEEVFRDLRVSASDDNKTSHNEPLLGVCSSHRRDVTYSNYSYKAGIVEHNEVDRADKPQDHQLTLPHPSSSENVIQQESTKNTIAVSGRKYETTSLAVTGYIKPSYPILVGNFVKVYPTNLFGSLPQHDKFLVKERLYNPTTGFTKSKLVLKSYLTEAEQNTSDAMGCYQPIVPCDNDDDDDDIILYYKQKKYNNPGCIIYTQPYVFIIVKTVYRPNEINIHSALKHNNLMAILIGKNHYGKFYLCLISKVDLTSGKYCQLKTLIQCSYLRYHYQNYLKELMTWRRGFNNIEFVLAETLEALAHLHDNGYVHRDVKASNITIKVRCHSGPLECTCSSRFQIKLGDFESAGTAPELGIIEPTDQMVKSASILPLGTPGYRAPEVSMHITLSGPYGALYTTAVDMWSFDYPCLNICIGKTAALKQREEALLLLSMTCTELWERTTKINELKKIKPFSYEAELLRLVEYLLQVLAIRLPA